MGWKGIRPHTMGCDCLVARELEKMPKECGTTDRHPLRMHLRAPSPLEASAVSERVLHARNRQS